MRFQKIKFRVHESNEIQTMHYSFNFAVSVTFSLCFPTLTATLILIILCYYHGRHIHEVPEEMNGMILTKSALPFISRIRKTKSATAIVFRIVEMKRETT